MNGPLSVLGDRGKRRGFHEVLLLREFYYWEGLRLSDRHDIYVNAFGPQISQHLLLPIKFVQL
jgi:hypothetical protein